MRRLRILTWHVHGNYLYYLSQVPHDFYLPIKPDRQEGYGGCCGTLPWPSNLQDVPAEEVAGLEFDCILFQSRKNYEVDQYEILSESQRRLPRIYLEHDPPQEHPTNTRHPAAGDDLVLVHVTSFNDLMWDSGGTPTRVIDHGVVVPEEVAYRGDLPRGIAVVNGLAKRGRRLGADVFERVRRQVPLDLVGMCSAELGGLGEIPYRELPGFLSRYRFFFNPIRYTSLGLAVCEAMTIGMPIVGLATTEMTTVVENGVSGFVDTSVDRLIGRMQGLLADPSRAAALGRNARRCARKRFSIHRFVDDWLALFEQVAGNAPAASAETAAGVAAL